MILYPKYARLRVEYYERRSWICRRCVKVSDSDIVPTNVDAEGDVFAGL